MPSLIRSCQWRYLANLLYLKDSQTQYGAGYD